MGPEKDAIMLLKLNYDIWGCAAKGPRLVQIIMNEERAKLEQERDAVQGALDAVDGQEVDVADDMEEEN